MTLETQGSPLASNPVGAKPSPHPFGRWCKPGARVVLDVESGFPADDLESLGAVLRAVASATGAPIAVRSADALAAWAKAGAEGSRASRMAMLDLLGKLARDDLLVAVARPPAERHAGETRQAEFISQMLAFQLAHRLVLITQDPELAATVDRNGRSGALDRSKPPKLLKWEHGELKPWLRETEKAQEDAGRVVARSVPSAATLASTRRIVIDTSSLMLTPMADLAAANGFDAGRPIGPEFLRDHLSPHLRTDLPLIVPRRVQRELEKHAKRHDDPHACAAAGQSLAIIAQLESKGLAVLPEDTKEVAGADERFADPVMLQVAARFQDAHDLCFITQDRQLAETLIDNQRRGGRPMLVLALVQSRPGALRNWAHENREKASTEGAAKRKGAKETKADTGAARGQGDRTGASRSPRDSLSPRASREVVATVAPFALATSPTTLKDTPLPVPKLPGSGDSVLSSKFGNITLTRELAAGGEGTVYSTDRSGVVCKIYQADRLTVLRQAKLELMLSREVRLPGICWPLDIARDSEGRFVGYLMPMASGKVLRLCAFDKRSIERNFPAWTREHLVGLAISILEAAQRLHSLNILIGDINPRNILVQDDGRIWLIDMDSVQIEGYPCPVGEVLYTPPQLQGRNFSGFLRSIEDEQFALATLVFQILLPGKPPYAAQGGEELAENIRKAQFPYDKDTDSRPPSGPWGFIWSHLSFQLKRAFMSTFAERKRVSVDEWLKALRAYRHQIREGRAAAELFPQRPFVPASDIVRVVCKTCPPGQQSHEAGRRHLDSLTAMGRDFECKKCQIVRQLDRVENTREVECESRKSPKCRRTFPKRIDKIEEMRAKGHGLWCQPCVEVERQEREARWAARQQRHHHGQGAGPCFVATATYQDAHAEPVRWLRAYRDTRLAASAPGRAFIRIYYRLGPWLARGLELVPALRAPSRRCLDALVRHLRHRHPSIDENLP